MVTMSIETPAQSEARLRRVMRETSIEWLRGEWHYDERSPRDDALAMVVADGQRSWLNPASPTDETERFTVFRARFRPEADNSGFVGWLASRIKSDTGSGVIVVCGYDPDQGGVFDYWGVPEDVGPAARELVDRLVRGSGDGLDGLVMRVVEADANAQIGPDTVFCFDEREGVITARYGGGEVTDGWLIGHMNGRELEFSYLQLGRDGAAASGRSTATIAHDEAGLLELTERFVWDIGGAGRNRLREE